jgi:ABC-2 type transport system ATP-binding protein
VPADAAVETQDLRKHFGDTLAVDGVSLRVEQGAVRGLLGRNGAGKTTLLRILFGLLPPDGGHVRLFGRDAEPDDVEARSGVSGYVEEPRFYPYLSGRRNLQLLARLDGGDGARIDEVLERVGLDPSRDAGVGNYSTGMRQRLGLAAALLRQPRLLLLDEPTIGLDPAGARDVRELLQELAGTGVTVLLSSHNMAEVDEICDSVVVIRRGAVVWDGTLERLRAEAPAASHRLWTSDDARALELGIGVIPVGSEGDHLVIRGADEARDRYVLALGAAGIAVRRLEPSVPPLEALFAELTGEEADG